MRTAIRRAGSGALLLALAAAAMTAHAQGYNATSIPAAFTDISVTGTPGPTGDDVLSAEIPLPVGFTFPFYGVNQTEFRISTNGYIDFGGPAASAIEGRTNAVLPNPVLPNKMIAALWDDLNVVATGTPPSQTDYQLVDPGTPGDPTDDRLIVQWTNLDHFATAASDLTFQVVLYQTGNIEIFYNLLTGVQTDVTVGVENASGAFGTTVYNDGTGSAPSTTTGWQFTFTPATGPVLTVIPPGPVVFAATGPCASVPSRLQTFTVYNDGTGTLTLSSITLGGGSSTAYSLDVTGVDFSLAAGESTTFAVEFEPTSGQTGTLLGTVLVNYDDGAPDTHTIDLSGTVDESSTSSSTGGGIAFRNNYGACTAGSPYPAPSGTGMINISGHTRITTWTSGTADDGFFTVDAATMDGLIGFVRSFGRNREQMFIGTNGYVTLTTGSTAVNNAIPTTTGGGLLAAAAMDHDFDPALYGGDVTGQFGAPGVFYGLSDADGDGGVDDLVITWWHAHTFGSTAYPAADARFLTAQMVIIKASRPNEDDIVEVRFPDGNDANGVPFRQNTSVGGPPTIENDIIVGLSPNSTSTGAAAEYHENAVGGPIYLPGGGSLTVRFSPETQSVASDEVAGWRMMGHPLIGPAFDVARLSELNLVQGVTNQYPAAADNLYTSYNGTTWVAPASSTTTITSGNGFIWYLYDTTFNPGDPAGTSVSWDLPMALQGTGAETSVTTNRSITVHRTGDGWNLIANPWRMSLNVTDLATWANGPLVSAVGQVWDPASMTYLTSTSLGNLLAPWQGMMIQNTATTGATSISVPPAARTTGGVFQGYTDEERLIAFELRGTTADTGLTTTDRAVVMYFHPEATNASDLLDAGKLRPLLDRYATAAFIGERSGEVELRAQESRPFEVGMVEIPMGIEAVGTTETLTLAWPIIENVPANWTMVLRDLVTATEIDLRTQDSYTFTVEPTVVRVASGGVPALGSVTAATVDPRFVVAVSSGTTGTGDNGPTVFALHMPAPNPVSGPSALVRFDLPESADATVEVFDMLGRRVATLAEGQREAGRHAARLDASDLASGSYVIRMRAGSFVQAQRLTIAR